MPELLRLHFPGVIQNTDGTIDFSLTEEEAREADAVLKAFNEVLVHPEAAEKLRNGMVAVALCRYAKDLVSVNCVGLRETEYGANRPLIVETLEKAVAAVWKAFSLYPLPIFLYHRAAFFQMLGMRDEAHRLFGAFIKRHSELTQRVYGEL